MNEALRPEDFGEPEIYIKYLKNKVFTNTELQKKSELYDQQRKDEF